MPFVVDASIAACWLLPDEGNRRADAAYARFPDDTAIAPSLWWFEMRNIFISSERRGRIDSAKTAGPWLCSTACRSGWTINPTMQH